MGAFGEVLLTFDHKIKSQIALKILVNTPQMNEQGQVEAQILAKLNGTQSKHIVKAYDFLVFRGHICITFEVLGVSLLDIIKKNMYTSLPLKLVRLYAIQIISALAYCHKNCICHCDLKPENVLVIPGSSTLVKLIDFGTGCFSGKQKFQYIQSRAYRAPEVMLGIPYGYPMDMWSLGTVIAELCTGKTLFPGKSESETLAIIQSIIGQPPLEVINSGSRSSCFFNPNGSFKDVDLANAYKPKSLDLRKIVPVDDQSVIDFILKCLTWDQNKRMTSLEALNHPWIVNKAPTILPSLKLNSK